MHTDTHSHAQTQTHSLPSLVLLILLHRSVGTIHSRGLFITGDDGSFEPQVYLPPNSGGELGDEGERGGGGKNNVDGEDEVKAPQPVHAAEVANQVKVGDTCIRLHQFRSGQVKVGDTCIR